MEGIIVIEDEPIRSDFYCENTLIASVINGRILFHPEAQKILQKWDDKKMKEFADYVATFVIKTMNVKFK